MANVLDVTPSPAGLKGRGQAVESPELLRALVHRVTHGFSPHEYALARKLGHLGYVEYHLDHLAIDDSRTEAALAPLDVLPMTSAEIAATGQPPGYPANQLKHAQILRSVTSRRQLFERTVAFFTNHLNIYMLDGGVRAHKVVDDREVIRAHAFGSFADMLTASAHSAAMLQYLDNYINTDVGPQENYGRELMELHTLGVDGGYDETDVKEAARCLTGWSFEDTAWKPNFGIFEFHADGHDDGQKTVLGQVFPAGQGQADGDQLLALVLGHPSTGLFLGRKLLQWFGVYEPPEDLVTEVAAVYDSTGGDIKAMLRVVLSPKAFAASTPWDAPKMKRPDQFVAGLFRALHADLTPPVTDWLEPTPLIDELTLMGQPPFQWPTPNGYPDTIEAWGTGLQPRWSLASRLTAGTCAAATIDPGTVMGALSDTGLSGWGDAIDQVLTGGGLSAADRAAIDTHAAGYGSIGWPEVAELIALAASSPSYQLY
jgi:uncharacterized protein (DUF1800 family)